MPPDELAGQQAALFARITGLPVGDAARAASFVVGDARGSAERRLQVYATMYRLRMAEALESQFPRVAARLGVEEFGRLSVAFLADFPSRHASLRELGRQLPAWLAAARPDQPALAGLARLEWARDDVFDLADQRPLAVETLRALPPERFAELPLGLIDAHRLLDLDATAFALWDEAPAERDARGGALVWRQDVTVYHRALGASERTALDAVARGTRFGTICEQLAIDRSDEEAAAQAFAWLSTWAIDGLLRDPT
ncbi:MAG TPA: DNA-binding domain-containing protein [Polyangia bacterium]|nr:DNA-binding domain-containing protein [Polyangia bacterium]